MKKFLQRFLSAIIITYTRICTRAFIKDDIFREYTYINILYNGVVNIFGEKARFTCQFYQTLSSLHPLYVNLMPLQPPRKPSSSALYRAPTPPFFSTSSLHPCCLSSRSFHFSTSFRRHRISPPFSLSLSLSLFHNAITLRIVWRISHEIYLRSIVFQFEVTVLDNVTCLTG